MAASPGGVWSRRSILCLKQYTEQVTRQVTKKMSRLRATFNGMICVALFLCSTGLAAQGLLTGARTGMIQELGQDDGFLVISGKRYDYDRQVTVVTWRGSVLDDAHLAEGMILRFTVDGDMLKEVQVLGPATILEHLNRH